MIRKKSRLLLIDIGAPFGGVETYLISLGALLANDYELFSFCALPEVAERLRQSGAHVLTVPWLKTRWSKILRFLWGLLAIPFMILRYDIQVVQTNGYLESLYLILARCLGRRTVRTAHGPPELSRYKFYQRPEMVLVRLAAMLSLRSTDRIICVSKAVRADFSSLVPGEKLYVAPNWVLTPAGTHEQRASSTTELLYVGRLEGYKGLSLLLEALKLVHHQVHLTVVGSGSEEAALRAEAASLPVSFCGFRNPASDYVQSAVFINPSFGPEGLPMVNLEAMRAGMACILSDLPVHQEISDDGRAALLFPTGDAQGLAKAINFLCSSADKRRDLSARAQELIGRRYSETAARSSYLNALDFDGSQLIS